ncbi:Imm51 family immunity protein [Sphingobacterium tabacisoli]|uniref:Imm51 family immunity protein n=1 Tax=Sphingobacterium tabacisoli TaxID=2044855 RepID=A0ABW5KZ01_9SPHI|nr:Imm51 family immunity protein [Sphingobacterium tabacisoli]
MPNDFFPCKLVKHQDSFSIICSDFHFFDDYFGDKEAGGYGIEKLAKKLAKENGLSKEIGFDSEAGMFCAYATDKNVLHQLCLALQKITGGADRHTSKGNTELLVPKEEAEKLLLQGFVIALDKDKQAEFLKNAPFPHISLKQKEQLHAIENGTAKEKITAAKKINSEARTKTRMWDNYLSHPQTVTVLLKAIDHETESKVIQELLWALVFICGRHLPDLRTKSYFEQALEHKSATIRWLGLMGLNYLWECPLESVLKMKEDKSEKVRKEAESVLKYAIVNKREFAPWMFDKENYKAML